MTKKKTVKLINEAAEKFNAEIVKPCIARQNVAARVENLLAVLAGAELNRAQVQDIREELDAIKWRLVELEAEARIQDPGAAGPVTRMESTLEFKGCPVTVSVQIPAKRKVKKIKTATVRGTAVK